ncbi:hypothetical protein L7F22_064279 [Adiantum nelumboides]|nr:hypothetical protein [Adiantum nelumboides]
MLPIDKGLRRLQTLCCKLQAIIAGGAGNTWTASNIYAGNTLVSLLCQGGEQELGQEIVACFAATVESRINPARPNRGKKQALPYFWVQDLEVLESLRVRLGLPLYTH